MRTILRTQPNQLQKLHEELLAAIPALAPTVDAAGFKHAVFDLLGDEDDLTIIVPDTVTDAAVDAVLAAHDASTPSLTEQLAAAAKVDRATLVTQYNTMLAGLETIQGHHASISQHAATLAGITFTGTLAQTQTKLQQTLQPLGTDLGTMEDDINSIAIGLERFLKGMAAIIRSSG
jgi:hypothetical protein